MIRNNYLLDNDTINNLATLRSFFAMKSDVDTLRECIALAMQLHAEGRLGPKKFVFNY